MRFSPVEIFLISLGTVVLTLVLLWLREEFLDWRATRHQREAERRHRERHRSRQD